MKRLRLLVLILFVIVTSIGCQFITIHTGDELGITIHRGTGKSADLEEINSSAALDDGAGSISEITKTMTAITSTLTQTATETPSLDVFFDAHPTVIYPTYTPTLTRTPVPKKYYKPTHSCPQLNLGTPCP